MDFGRVKGGESPSIVHCWMKNSDKYIRPTSMALLVALPTWNLKVSGSNLGGFVLMQKRWRLLVWLISRMGFLEDSFDSFARKVDPIQHLIETKSIFHQQNNVAKNFCKKLWLWCNALFYHKTFPQPKNTPAQSKQPPKSSTNGNENRKDNVSIYH
jgi:hypothetical protein